MSGIYCFASAVRWYFLPRTEAELSEVMKTRTLEAYVASGGKPDSMLDHFMDKLFHLRMASGCEVLEKIAVTKREVMAKAFFAYTHVFSTCVLTGPIYAKPMAGEE